MKKKTQRILIIILAVVMVLSIVVPALSVMVGAVTQKDIDAKKNQVNSIEDEIDRMEDQIAAIQKDKSAAMERKLLLDDKVELLVSQIHEIEGIITQYDEMIVGKEAEIADLELREAEQYALFCRQVRDMEEQGSAGYLEVLLTSASFTELLDSLMLIDEVMEYNSRIIEELEATQAAVAQSKAELEAARAEQEQSRLELEGKQAELEKEAAAAQALLDEIKADEAEAQKLLEEKEKAAKEMEAEVKKMEKQLAAQIAAAAAANQGTGKGNGSFIWPVDSRRVTSTFGGRASPGGIGSTNHKGLDIGGVGYTSKVYASKAGVVTISKKNSSYGNYIAISHGDGTTTLYAHLSSRKVSVGDTVKQGQVIGITGSTGNSTGPHLHFEVWVNGVKKNPLNYLSGSYTMSR